MNRPLFSPGAVLAPTLIASTLLLSTLAVAGPYVGVGYQVGKSKIERSELESPVVDGRPLDLSKSTRSSDISALLGYQLNDAWSLELSWQQAEVDGDFELRQPGQDEEWEASVQGDHFALTPVYRHPLSEHLGLRASAGLVYGRYDIRQSHGIDVENGADQSLSNATRRKSEFGGMVGAGLEYTTPWKFDVVGEVRYQRTKLMSNSAALVHLVYRF